MPVASCHQLKSEANAKMQHGHASNGPHRWILKFLLRQACQNQVLPEDLAQIVSDVSRLPSYRTERCASGEQVSQGQKDSEIEFKQ